ncbi:MAG: DUF445 family protein [Myxococcales bacterium]|nr:DUF445 family protein [Myxococcales bacterium]
MPYWLYLVLVVPSISAFIGFLTNWQAVKMIFWPAKRVGIGPLGWQGILFHHSDKFATNLGRIAKDDLLSSQELVERADIDQIDPLVAPVLDAEVPALVAEVANTVMAGAWDKLPPPMQEMVIAQVKQRSRAVAKGVIADVQGTAAEILDLQDLVKAQLSGPNVERLARLTQQIGKNEFRFIEWSGGLFGAIIGFGQIAVWGLFQFWWVMPIFGVIVGLITNWLAIQMIFRPMEPRRYLGLVRYQGLFPKRQAEIAADYGATTAAEVITPRTVIDFLTAGERGERLAAAVRASIERRLDAEWEQVRGLVPMPISDEVRATIKAQIVARLFDLAPRIRPEVEAYLQGALDIQNTVERKLGELPKPEFERLLRGVFQQDELTLILVGGVLGGGVGCLQAAAVLAF